MSLQSIIQQIKTATLPGENTALRIGSALEQMDDAKRDKSDSLSASDTMDMINAVKLLAVSGTPFLGTIAPATTIPAGNFWAFAGEGTYPNAGGIIVGAGEIAIITRVGTTFDSVILDVPVRSIEDIEKTSTVGLVDTYTITYSDGSTPTTFEVTNGDGNTTDLNIILKSFLTPISNVLEILATDGTYGWSVNILKNDNTKEATGNLFATATNILTGGRQFLDIRLIRYSTVQQYLDQYSSILGIKSDGTIDVILIGKLNTLPKVYENFTFDISDYEKISICYDVVDSNNPQRPDIKLYDGEVIKEDSVKKYIDNIYNNIEVTENVYKNNIKEVVINIDQFTGTDDQKIEKATAMAENVNGSQIYFPNRQINITKAFLIVSNVKYVIAGQIQMANNIHDNIFRPKNLIVNPAQLGGKCLTVTWTENFEMEFLPSSSIRQSIIPLHTGGQYGWRGVSALFVRCRNYKVTGLKVIESHMWSVSNEFCENGEFYDLYFDNTLYVNADGLNFRNGCKNMVAKRLRGRCTDNAMATTILDYTLPPAADAYAGYSYQAMGWTFGDFNGADNILVEDCQVAAQYGQGLIIASGFKVSNITYKDFIATTPTANDWDNVSVCANQYRNIIYGTSFVPGNLTNINIINSQSNIHQYALSVYGNVVNNLYAIGTIGAIKNDTGTVIKP